MSKVWGLEFARSYSPLSISRCSIAKASVAIQEEMAAKRTTFLYIISIEVHVLHLTREHPQAPTQRHIQQCKRTWGQSFEHALETVMLLL